MKKTGMNKIGGMKGGKGTKAKKRKINKMAGAGKAKIMKQRSGQKTMKKNIGKKTEMRKMNKGMKVENFKDMMFKKFGGGKT